MAHCGVAPPHLSPTYPVEGDYWGRSNGDWHNVPGGYTMRRRNINNFCTGIIPSFQPNNEIARYGKVKVVCENVWCTTCQSKGNRRDECSTLGNYMATGAPNPFPTVPWIKWCEIFKQWGHIPPHYPTLEKYQKMHHTSFCEFCKYMGHDVNNCRSLQLM